MIYDLSEVVLAFRLNGMSNSLPSPSNLRRWGVKFEGKCTLCNKKNATAAHILSNCIVALNQDRYTWRHDNVLTVIHKDLVALVRRVNSRNASRPKSMLPPISFHKKGKRKLVRPNTSFSIFDAKNASDWQINFDFFHNSTIPAQSLVDTNLRPDIVIFSL